MSTSRGVAPDRPGTDAHDIVNRKVAVEPVRGIVGIVDEERAAPDIGIPETPDENRGGTSLVAA
jgi:hypothetical protein